MTPSNSVDVFRGLRKASACTAVPTSAPKPAQVTRSADPREEIWYLLDAKRCRFEYREQAGGAYEHAVEVCGTFVGLWLEWFPGFTPEHGQKARAKAACYCACVLLIDERDRWITVKVGGAVPYYILAAKMRSARKGDVIHIRPEAVGNSCCFDVFIRQGDAWRLPPRTEVCEGDTAARVQEGTERFYSHPAYLPTRETPGPDEGIKGHRPAEPALRLEKSEPAPAEESPRTEARAAHPRFADRDSGHTTPVRQRHAHVPLDGPQAPGPIEILAYRPFIDRVGLSPVEEEAFVVECRRIHIRARELAAECQMARCLTPEAVLSFARNHIARAA